MPSSTALSRITEVLLAVAALFLLATPVKADDVIINKRYPVSGKDLSPPSVEATNECATSVFVDAFVPHATIKVFLNGATIIGGPIAPEFGFAAISLSHPLHTGDKITATQTVNGVTSQPSVPMVAGAMPAKLPAPSVTPPIYACGQVVPVNGLTSGVKVEVRDSTSSTTVGNGATPNSWGNDWAPVATSNLTAGHAIDARQTACTGVTSPFSASQAVSGDPSPNTQAVRRPRTVSGTTPGGPTGHRTPVEINAETGQALGEMTERAAARAARRLALRETIDRVHPSEREMLRHLFGLNLPGR